MNDKCTPYQDTLYCAVTVHTVNTIWNTSERMLKLILTYEVNRAAWLKGIYLIQSRGRHFSPSLPARRSTQGRGTTGIWNSAKSISELQAENLGWIVMVQRLGSAHYLLVLVFLSFYHQAPFHFICAVKELMKWVRYIVCLLTPSTYYASQNVKPLSSKP